MTKENWVQTAIAFMVISVLLAILASSLYFNPHIRFREFEVPKIVEKTVEVPKLTFVEKTVEIPKTVEKLCEVVSPVPRTVCAAEPKQDHELHPGETWTVPGCWTCVGDIVAEGQRLYDDREETGLIVYFTKPATITAPYGANCLVGDHRIDKEIEQKETGCVGGCKESIIKIWPLVMPTPIPCAEAPTPTEEKVEPGKILVAGEKWTVPIGWTCSGDIVVWPGGLFALYDDLADTGLVVDFAKSAKIHAPWGAYCDPDDGPEVMKARLLAEGCGLPAGCSSVKVVTWPADLKN